MNHIKPSKQALGICIGASTISVVELHIHGANNGNPATTTTATTTIVNTWVESHKGEPRKVLTKLLELANPTDHHIAVTGRKFRDIVTLSPITEPEALEESLQYLFPESSSETDIKSNHRFPTSVVSAGGESFLVYAVDAFGKVTRISSGNKCASGTGEFFMQQLKRMNLTPEQAAPLSQVGKSHSVSGRCSVFCKSDCTHALNKGVPISDVTAGLSKMIARKILELLYHVDKSRVMIVGGMTKNPAVIDWVRKDIDTVIVPDQAFYFEALGAGLWALKHQASTFPGFDTLFTHKKPSFSFLNPLSNFEDQVEFKTAKRGTAQVGDVCVVGLDVGSTTTKAVVMRISDHTILASEYLRTNGDPVRASRACYASLTKQVDPSIKIVGVGTTGSGRQIAGLHALTEGVVNEIIAHATAAAYFDPEVDTIFEIGGQDAKYTYLVNQVPCDYAMNEACSAGTGSFLEESAYESLQVNMEEIAEIAVHAPNPLNFSDQCSAFISSDIKTALQEGISKEDIVAGLVYSICINYNNRVKGNRSVGKKIFFQGGVCYNRSIPLAMAALTGRKIIVPPEPGLMGAFGVAIEIQKRLDLGLLERQQFHLQELADREINAVRSFTCKGGKEKCDIGCEINTYAIDGKNYPFGGACNRYYNLRHEVEYDSNQLDFVKKRYQLVFETFAQPYQPESLKPLTIGMNRSFRTHTLYPLFFNYFSRLGCQVVLSDEVYESGIERANTALCYPAQIALGLFEDLLQQEPDYIFLPHIIEIHVAKEKKYRQEFQTTCMMVQGEPFYIQASYKERTLKGDPLSSRIISPTLNLSSGFDAERKTFQQVAKRLGFSTKESDVAMDYAVEKQLEFFQTNKNLWYSIQSELESNPDEIAIILFGRSYNAFAPHTNKGVPHKFVSRGIRIIPFDALPYESYPNYKGTYWEIGQRILRAAQMIKDHPQLFGTYITNFMCALDSMLVQHFRDIMGRKPSLTLEVDGHTADAGINTRIDAFLDVIQNYRKLMTQTPMSERGGGESGSQDGVSPPFKPAEIVIRGTNTVFIDSQGSVHKLTDPQIKVIIPSMGEISTEGFASVFRSLGIQAEALPQFDTEAFRLAMTYHSGKECLPLIILTGSLLKYLKYRNQPDEKLVYFTVGSGGNCRVGQYNIFLKRLIEKRAIPDTTTLALNNEESYVGLGTTFRMSAWTILIIADIMEDIRWVIASSAYDKENALALFKEEWERIKLAMENKRRIDIMAQLKESMQVFREQVHLKVPLNQIKTIGIVGEIYCRRDHFSLQNIPARLAEKGFATRIAPIHEWILYMDYCIQKGYQDPDYSLTGRIEASLSFFWQRSREKAIKKICSTSGLYKDKPLNIDHYIRHSTHLVPAHLKGEPGLSSGNALSSMLEKYCGIINIGPFGCNNSRLTEAILTPEMTILGKKIAMEKAGGIYPFNGQFENAQPLPFFSIETDGNPFPQLIESQFENFCLQAGRLHEKMLAATLA